MWYNLKIQKVQPMENRNRDCISTYRVSLLERKLMKANWILKKERKPKISINIIEDIHEPIEKF